MLLLVNTQYTCIFCMHCVIILLLFKDIQCANLSAPANGEIVSCSSGRIGVGYEGDTCIFTCNSGHEPAGRNTSRVRTCQSDGSWSGSDVVCITGNGRHAGKLYL